MSLLRRIEKQPVNNNQSNKQMPNNNNNQNNDQDNTPPPDPNTYLTNTRTTVHREIVRFSLEGLGDPFYRVLGHQMNPDMGDLNKLSLSLEAGGERVDTLIDRLDADWHSYDLIGAMLVFRFDQKHVKGLAKPMPMPTPITANDDDLDFLDDDDDEDMTEEERIKKLEQKATAIGGE